MSTLNQKIVAGRIKKRVGKGRIIIGKEMRGIYTDSMANNPQKLTKSKGFQEEMKPIIEQLEEERQRAILLLQKKITKAQYHQLVDAVDKLTKNIQLLSGGETERAGLTISFDKSFNAPNTSRKTTGSSNK